MTNKTDGIDYILKSLSRWCRTDGCCKEDICEVDGKCDKLEEAKAAILDYVEKILPEALRVNELTDCLDKQTIFREGFNNCHNQIKQSIAKERGGV